MLVVSCTSLTKHSATFDASAESLDDVALQEIDRTGTLTDELKAPQGPYLLGAGDEIVIYRLHAREDDPNASLKTFIMPDGHVHFDLAQPVQARGKTVSELSQAMTEALRPFYKRPEVSVALYAAKSKQFSVLGKVYQPNVFPLNQPTTLLDAIARAGGLELAGGTGTTEELADLSRGILSRNGKTLPIDFEALFRRGDMRYNIYMQDKDFIFLPPKSTKEILVLGEVGVPKAVGWREGIGLVGAIAEARGTKPTASLSRVLLVRGSFSKPKVAVLDFQAITTGKTPDVRVLPGDILWVPRNPWENIQRYLDVVLNAAVETMAVNEGIRSVLGDDASGVQVQLEGGSQAPPAPPPVTE